LPVNSNAFYIMAVLSIGYIFVAILGSSGQTSFFDYVISAENRL